MNPKRSLSFSRTSEIKTKDRTHLLRLFPNVKSALIEDFSCALLDNGFIVQGFLYCTMDSLCFSPLFNQPQTIILLTTVTSITTTDLLFFPHSIDIQSTNQMYRFHSFLFRDFSFQLIKQLWLRVLAKELSDADSNTSCHSIDLDLSTSQLVSNPTCDVPNTTSPTTTPTINDLPSSLKDLPNIPSEEPTAPLTDPVTCPCIKTHHSRKTILIDELFPISYNAMFQLLFTNKLPKNADHLSHKYPNGFIHYFLVKKQYQNIESSEWNPSLEKNSIKETCYNIPLGLYTPKSYIESTIIDKTDFYSCILSTTKTPEVPYGSTFKTNVYTCILKNNVNSVDGCRVLVCYDLEWNCDVNWLAKTAIVNPLKSKIFEYHQDLKTSLRDFIFNLEAELNIGLNSVKQSAKQDSALDFIDPEEDEVVKKTLLSQPSNMTLSTTVTATTGIIQRDDWFYTFFTVLLILLGINALFLSFAVMRLGEIKEILKGGR